MVDGDQEMWLRASPALNVVVVGLRGEPYLRFTSTGVAVNTRAATWYLNRLRPEVVPRGLTATTPPLWKRLTARHRWTWHEDRMHALVLAAHPAGNVYLGRWAVPLVIDGRRTAIRGGLWQSAPASLLWFWPILLALVCVPALLKLREARLGSPVGAALAVVALVSSTVARLGRELYGRPTVSSWQLALVASTCLVAVALAASYSRRDWRKIGGLAIGVAATYQGLALVATLRDGWVLAAIPGWLERTATALSLASGVALVVVSVTGGIPDREPEEAPNTERGAELLVDR